MRFGLTLRRLLGALALCILTEAKGLAGDLSLLPPTDSICEGNALITTQAEWDLFAADYEGCTTFVGDITIDNSLAEIDSLYGLDSVRTMVGDLTIDYNGSPITSYALSGLDSLAGDLSISNCGDYMLSLPQLRIANDIVFNNNNSYYFNPDDETATGFQNLLQCNTISIQGYGMTGNGHFNQLHTCQRIEFHVFYDGTIPVNISNSFNALVNVETIICRSTFSVISSSFQNIPEIEYLELGGLGQYYTGNVDDSFISLTNAGTIHIGTFEYAASLPSLVYVENIYIDETPNERAINRPILSALEVISGECALLLCRNTIEFPALVSAFLLQISAISDNNHQGSNSILLPSLTTASYLSIYAGSISGEIDTSLHSFYAPLLYNVGETISIGAPALTSCISPAFCESANYSPNWDTLIGGPGCSTVEEIQAQCESPCPDIDLNGICDSVQTVYIGDLEFTSTSEVQTFANAFPSVHKIIGDLTLSGYTGDALFETEALINLDTIQGLLSYSNYDQADIAFSGFSNLRHVDTFIGAYPYYNYGITYNENDSTPIYSYCTNCFPSLISANKMQILTANEFSFNALERCDTLNINCSELNGAFSSLTQCKVLNINTNYFSSNQGSFFNPFDDNPYSLLNTILQQNEYACQSTIFSSFNQLDSINFFFATDAEISQSLNNIQHCKTIYVNNISTSESLMNLNSCENIYSNGNSSIMSCFDNITTLNTVGIYSSENIIDFPNLRELDFADFFLNDNSILNLPLLDSIHYYAFIITNSLALNATINLSGLDYAQNLTFTFVQCNELQLPSNWSCGNLGIQNVQGLVSLNDISIVEPGYINITECSDFSVCSSPGLCEHISQYPENCFFANNAPGCSSIEEIQTQCLGSYASGAVYYDLNCDQQFNNDDALVSYPILLQGDTLPLGSSGEAGYFFVPLELNSTTTLFAQYSSDWSSDGPITLTTTDSLQVFTDLQIGLCPVTTIHDVAVNVNASMDPRPGFTVRYNLVAQNLWPGSDSASVVFNTDQMPSAVITGYSSGGTLDGNQVSFTTDLLYGQSQTLWVDVLVPVGTPLGTAFTATAAIALNDAQAIDSHPENNNYTLAQTVIGSYDPNDKLVTLAVIDLLDIDSTQTATIEYTIRFQNTGTAEAIFVRVLDTLSQALNPATFELIATSHPSEITFHDNHVIEWFFDNILLPDSFSNEPGSHGFIQFRIRTNELSAPFNLENSAAIYFDFNEPVITAPAVTAVVICAEAGSVCDDGDACTIGDVIQADCTCTGTLNCNYSVIASADRICDGSNGFFNFSGPPNGLILYALNGISDTLSLNEDGNARITILNDSANYSYNVDSLYITYHGYKTSINSEIREVNQSDTLIYHNHKKPQISISTTTFDECYSTFPNTFPYTLYEVKSKQGWTIHYSLNYENIQTWSMPGTEFEQRYPNGDILMENSPYVNHWFDLNEPITTSGQSNFQTSNPSDSIYYFLVETITSYPFPQNSPLNFTIDSTSFEGCSATYIDVINTIQTPSMIMNLETYSLFDTSTVDADIPESNYTPITYYDAAWWQLDYYWQYLALLNEDPITLFSYSEENQLIYVEPNITISFLINTDTASFFIQQSDDIALDTVQNNVFECSFGFNSVGSISYKKTLGDFPRNDSISIQLIGYSGLDGCLHSMPLIPNSDDPNPNPRFNFIINPTNWLGTDTLQFACNDSLLLIAPVIPIDPGPDTLLSHQLNFGYTLWFTDYEDPLHSIININDTNQIFNPGVYYVTKIDSLHNVYYEKAFVVLPAEPSPCDDLDPCTINDITQPDCSCTGTFADNDNDGICDTEDACDNALAGTACDDGDPCTINDLFQPDCSCAGTFADNDNDGICDAEDACDNALAGTACDDGDPCTIGDTYQADCSCLGSLLDNDNDGLCDLSAPCDGVIIGEPCDDLDPCTINDLTQPDCSCAGTFADNDNDGICDAEDACDNTLAGTACDDGDACTINDLIQSDCSCEGTVADSDSDGICDASEIAGCMDIEACNYNTLATDDDGSCVFVESLTIEGNLTAVAGVSESYYYPGPATSSYQWTITLGTIQSGQGTPTVSVIWNDAPLGTLEVTETNESACVGSTIVLDVNITPNTISQWNAESIIPYPNPANDILHLSGDISSNAQVSIYNSVGQCVYTGSFSSTIDVRSFAGGVYHLNIGHNGTYENMKFTILRD